MAIEAKEKTINGNHWRTETYPAMFGLRIFNRLRSTIGLTLQGVNADTLDQDAMQLIGAFINNLPQDNDQLIVDILSKTWVNDKEISQKQNFDMHFAGNYGELMEGLIFVLRHNYGDVFQSVVDFTSQSDASATDQQA